MLLLKPWPVGVESSGVVLVATDETDPGPRLRDRTVTLVLPITDPRGEARGGVGLGAGSFERAEWTRASRRCICAVRDRMWVNEVDGGSLFAVARVDGLEVVDRGAGVLRDIEVFVADRVGGREDAEDDSLGLGVTLVSIDGSLDFLGLEAGWGVLMGGTLVLGIGGGAEASDMGGDGGSLTGVFVDDTEDDSGGVVISGELAPETMLLSKMGLSGMERSVRVADMWRSSCFLSLSCRISASIFRSDSSSRSRCASILSCSLSCSPILISSSIMTALSIAALYLESRSSSDEVVCLACRSKSSFATSISRSLCCRVRLVSLRVVISFSRVFWAALVSFLDSLYFRCKERKNTAVSQS